MSKNIYEEVIIVLNEKNKTYEVIRDYGKENSFHVAFSVKEIDVAIAIKKAYCDGFVDGKRGASGNDK